MNATTLGYLSAVELRDLFQQILQLIGIPEGDLPQKLASCDDFYQMQLSAAKTLKDLDRMAEAFNTFYTDEEHLAMYKVALILTYIDRHEAPEKAKAVHRKADFIYEN